MKPLDQTLLDLLAAAPGVAPIFVHSANATAVLNVSEELFAGILARFAPKPAAA